MHPKHPVAETVERADPHAACIHLQHRLNSRQHFARRLVREGHGEDAARRRPSFADKPPDTGRQYPGLTGSCAGKHECVLIRQRHCFTLFRVQAVE